MNQPRTAALSALLDDLAGFEIKISDYWADAEPQGHYDTLLTGLINSLLAFCHTLGWSELAGHLRDMAPLRGNAVESLETLQRFVVPEARRPLAASDIEKPQSPNQWFWEFVHPRISALARPRFEAGFFGDAVESSFKELNDAVKRIVRDTDGRELDGAALMTTAFSPNNPVIRLTPIATATDKDEQQGYMQIMAGSMTGIRNPKAHGNLNPDSTKTLHLICLASLLMRRLDERI
ncbi:MAG: TIGR02391 family protein [Bryobacterales bacterium]|nr:TIGR02391 family protein [Bryobacterales bacterium]